MEFFEKGWLLCGGRLKEIVKKTKMMKTNSCYHPKNRKIINDIETSKNCEIQRSGLGR